MNVDSVIAGFESTVSDNRHILEQFVDFDLLFDTLRAYCRESVRAGLIRAEVVRSNYDPNDPGAGASRF